MNAKELVELNNQKRKELTKENLKYYEDMLVYIRLSYDKSEQETEEVLSELLDHLLEAQREGRTAEEVFGSDPKKYADEIVGELPKMVTKDRVKYVVMGLLYFFAAGAIFSAVLEFIIHFLTKKSLVREVFVGTLITETILLIPLAFIFLYTMVQIIRWLCFKRISKLLGFLIYWGMGIVWIGIYLGLFIIVPEFGPRIEVHEIYILLTGVILLILAITASKLFFRPAQAK